MSSDGPYRRVGKIVLRYWHTYGGWREVAGSPYFLAAVIATIASCFYWTVSGWWELAISIVPSMLGFTLGGYAMLVGFGGESFRSMISGKSVRPDGTTKESPFINMNASFVHFIVVQALALFAAILAKTVHGTSDRSWLSLFSYLLHIAPGTLGFVALPFWAVGFLLFMYAMTLTVAAVFSVFRVGTWVDLIKPSAQEPSSATTAQPTTAATTNPQPTTAPASHPPPVTKPPRALVSAPVVVAYVDARREAEAEAEEAAEEPSGSRTRK